MRADTDHRDAVTSIQAYYSPLIQHAEQASIGYAQIAVRTCITLNAGVAVAFPTIAELFVAEASIYQVFIPIGLALFGALTGLLCAWIVYLNHSFEAMKTDCELQLALINADEHFNSSTFHRFRQKRDNERAHYSSYLKKYENRRDQTFYVANTLGFISAGFFAASVVIFAISIA